MKLFSIEKSIPNIFLIFHLSLFSYYINAIKKNEQIEKIKCISPKLTLTNNLVGNGGKTYSLNSKLVESARCCLLWQHVLCTPCIHKTFLLLDIQGPQNACISWVFVWKKCSSMGLL